MKLTKTAIAAAISLAGLVLAVQANAAPAAPQVNDQILKQSIALHVNADGSYSETVSRVAQPLTIAGVSAVGHVEIAYPANFATVKVLDAYTETVTHQRVNVLPSQIFNQSTPTAVQAPFLSDGHVMSLLYSAVTPGAEVHLKYVETFKRPYLPGVYAISEALAPQVPVQATDISITAPKSMHLHYQARGPWHETRVSTGNMHTLTASAASPSVDFPPMNTAAITQYAPMAVIGTAATWEDIGRAYDHLAAPALAVTPAIRAQAAKIAQGAGGEVAVARIYHWLQQHMQPVDTAYTEAGYAPVSAQSTLARGIGNSNAGSVLLCALLRAQGIAAVPALISTSARYVPYPGADPFAFEHMLAYVPAYHLFLDPSARYAGIDALPLTDAGKPVLIAGPRPQFTRTPGPDTARVQYREVQNLVLHRDGVIDGVSHITAAGWQAIDERAGLLGDRSGRRLDHFMQTGFYMSGKVGSMRVAAVENRRDLDKPLELTLRWQDSDAAIPGPQMALVLPTPGTISGELLFFVSQATRAYPSVLTPGTFEEQVHLRLPAGMRPEQLPAEIFGRTPFGSYSVTYHYAGGVLDVDKRLTLTRFVVDPQQYPALHRMALDAVGNARRAILLRGAG